MIAARTTEKKVSISRSRLRILQRHFEDDVYRIPTAVDYLFHQLEQIAQKNHLLCLVIDLVKIAQQIELQFGVHFARRRCVSSLAQLFHHREHGLGRLIKELHLFAETATLQIFRANQDALAYFLHRLRDFIKRGRKRLNVFTLQRGDKRFAKLLGQLLGDLFVFAPAVHELLQTLRRLFLLEPLQQRDQMMHARVRLLRARFQQIIKLLVASEDFLDRQHDCLSCSRGRCPRPAHFSPSAKLCSATAARLRALRWSLADPKLVSYVSAMPKQSVPPPKKNFIRRFFSLLGPGLITGAADDDPSGVATYSIAGAQMGTSLLWTAFITWPFMGCVQFMCARIGMVTGRGLGSALGLKFPRWLLVLASLGLLTANTLNVRSY